MSKSIQVKQPELETKRISVLQNESDFLKKRSELQEKLLMELSKSQGDILKNEVIIGLGFIHEGSLIYFMMSYFIEIA